MAIDDILPGANCGGCGLPGCSANAEAIVRGKASPDSCVAGGADLAIAIAEISVFPLKLKNLISLFRIVLMEQMRQIQNLYIQL